MNGSGPCCGGFVNVMPNTLGLGLGVTLTSGVAVSVAVEVGKTVADGETDGVGEIEDDGETDGVGEIEDVGETDGDGDPHGLLTCWTAITVDGANTPFGKCGSGPSIPSKRVVPITNST